MPEAKKSYLVVTIGRTMGSGGSFVGKRLASRLGCRYLDRELLVEAARRMHKEPSALEAYDEHRLNFWERTRMAYAFGVLEAPYTPPAITVDDMELFEVQKAILLEGASKGPVVVVGRSGFSVLKDEPGLLSVFLHAPSDARAERIRKIYSLPTIEEARELVEQSDRQRANFIKAASGLDWRDPRHYHLAVDTFRLGTAATVELLYDAAMEVSRKLSGPEEELF